MIYFPCDLLAMCNPELNNLAEQEQPEPAVESPAPATAE